jgi:CRISPR system Cascade subunit CasD
MNVLLLRLSGVLQAWGTQSNFGVRDTGQEPSKSAVLGLLYAALGYGRGVPIHPKWAGLRMGVRVDQEGTVLRDFHTAGIDGIRSTDGRKVLTKYPVVSNRYYLADARFLVGLESPDMELLERLHAALRAPVWPLYLGRKSCVPGEPVWLRDGLRPQTGLLTALTDYPWLGCHRNRTPEELRVVLEDEEGVVVRPDQPLSFSQRRFAPRRVTTTFVSIPEVEMEDSLCISPD